jgi:hypothetical protein
MICKRTNNTTYTPIWKIFFPDCRRRVAFCTAGAGAYLAAVTVCLQSL